jgi:hypothetical protein
MACSTFDILWVAANVLKSDLVVLKSSVTSAVRKTLSARHVMLRRKNALYIFMFACAPRSPACTAAPASPGIFPSIHGHILRSDVWMRSFHTDCKADGRMSDATGAADRATNIF